MQTIGLIGGLSWHSTAAYYRRLNELAAAARGGHTSAKIAMASLDFAEVRACQIAEDYEGSGRLLAQAAAAVEAGGADFVAICSNLMHKNFAAVESAVAIPGVHIADAVAREAARSGWSTLGLIGTRGVMEEPFYADRLARHGILVVTPDSEGRTTIDRVVFEELTQGVVTEGSRAAYVVQLEALAAAGAQAVVLACTEIGLLIGPDDSPLPLINSVEAHVQLLSAMALGPATGA